MPINVLKRPINQPIHIEQPISHSFCDGKFKLTDEDKEYFRILRKLTEEEKPTDHPSGRERK